MNEEYYCSMCGIDCCCRGEDFDGDLEIVIFDGAGYAGFYLCDFDVHWQLSFLAAATIDVAGSCVCGFIYCLTVAHSSVVDSVNT